MFPINVAAMPAVPTRKALVVVDLQNDFVTPDGALPVTQPDGFVDRILELVKVFRDSGAGDVVWVRSEFEQHRALATEGDTIIASDIPIRPSATRRCATSKEHNEKLMAADEEAFLTVDKPTCVRKGTPGADFPPNIEASIMRGRDFVTTKSHYSAFPPGQSQLVQQLRMRFVTDMYVCGSLTNVGVFATALEAGKHAYDITIVEDCCGYRSYARHVTAIQQLEKFTGCDLLDSPALIDKLQRAQLKNLAKHGHGKKPSSGSRDVQRPGKAEESNRDRDRVSSGPPKAPTNPSTGLSPTMAKVSINLSDISPIEPLAPSQGTTNSGSSTTPQPRQATSNANVLLTQPMVTHGHLSNRLADSLAPLEAAPEADIDNIESELLSIKRRNVVRVSQSPSGASGVLGAEVPVDGADLAPSSHGTRVAVKPRSRRDKTSMSSSSSSPSQVQGNNRNRNSAEAREQIKDTPPNPASSNQPDPNTPQSSTESPETHTKTSSTTIMEEHQKSTVSEPLCEGDTTVITNALSPDLAADAFERLLEEVSWAGMSHLGGEVPRRIAVQGAVDQEGNMPVYRHPADESPPLLPFSPTVLAIKNEIEKHLGHPLNHVLIQHYRNSSDYISEHSDKTLDIVRGSYIANVSLGAERTMVLRTKRPPKDKDKDKKDMLAAAAGGTYESSSTTSAADKAKRQIQRAPLPHNSLLRMGLQTNMRWLHAIRPDKRSDRDKSFSELAYSGARISLTFRHIGTFLNASLTKIWGQGAVGKTKEEAQPVVNGQTDEAVRMLQAFGHENHVSEFDWEKNYGGGFNVLHMGSPKRFFAGSVKGRACTVENTRVALALADMGIGVARGAIDASGTSGGGSGEDEYGDGEQSEGKGRNLKAKVGVKFVDNDPARTEVVGDVSILRYLDAVYGAGRRYDQMTPAQVAKRFARLEEADELWMAWGWLLNRLEKKTEESDDKVSSTSRAEKVKQVIGEKKALLKQWEEYAREAHPTTTTESKAVTPPASEQEETKTQPKEPPAKDHQDKRHLHMTPFYICGGETPSPADYALWPVLHEIVTCADGDQEVLRVGEGYLARYYMAFKQRGAVAKVVLGGGNPSSASGDGGGEKGGTGPASGAAAAAASATGAEFEKTVGAVVALDVDAGGPKETAVSAGEDVKIKTSGCVSVVEKVEEKTSL